MRPRWPCFGSPGWERGKEGEREGGRDEGREVPAGGAGGRAAPARWTAGPCCTRAGTAPPGSTRAVAAGPPCRDMRRPGGGCRHPGNRRCGRTSRRVCGGRGRLGAPPGAGAGPGVDRGRTGADPGWIGAGLGRTRGASGQDPGWIEAGPEPRAPFPPVRQTLESCKTFLFERHKKRAASGSSRRLRHRHPTRPPAIKTSGALGKTIVTL